MTLWRLGIAAFYMWYHDDPSIMVYFYFFLVQKDIFKYFFMKKKKHNLDDTFFTYHEPSIFMLLKENKTSIFECFDQEWIVEESNTPQDLFTHITCQRYDAHKRI